jgi:hypothetical protein
MGEQKLNKNRGKANKNHGNWIWKNEGQLIGVTYKTFILYEPINIDGQIAS